MGSALIDGRHIGLMSICGGMVPGDSNIDRSVHDDFDVSRSAHEVAVAASPGAMVREPDHVGTDQMQQGGFPVIEPRIVPAPSVTSDARYLNSVLVDVDVIRLVGVSMSAGSRNRYVHRVVENHRRVDEGPGKNPIAAIAGTVEIRAK